MQNSWCPSSDQKLPGMREVRKYNPYPGEKSAFRNRGRNDRDDVIRR